MKRLCLIFITLLCIISGCNSKTNQLPIPNAMPQEMPEDFNFMVRFGYGEVRKNEINTYKDQVVKDLIIKGTATADIALTTEEMRSIYKKMYEINVMGMQDVALTGSYCSKEPYNEESWQMTVDGAIQSLMWSDQHCDVTNEADQLLKLRKFIQQIVENKEAYKELPEAEGGYE
ncbi:hypothetical protein [Paenibacillus pabuli]|nr:hypothetical protein [Paenibacillus pabuli]MEC0127547.1 hypothetical protein [Paenibacillus pabuli]